MNSVLPQYRSTSGGYPYPSQCVSIDFVILDESHSSFMDVNTTVKAVMNPVLSDDGITVGTDLDTGKSVAMDVIVLDQSPTVSKHVYTTLLTVVYFVVPDDKNIL